MQGGEPEAGGLYQNHTCPVYYVLGERLESDVRAVMVTRDRTCQMTVDHRAVQGCPLSQRIRTRAHSGYFVHASPPTGAHALGCCPQLPWHPPDYYVDVVSCVGRAQLLRASLSMHPDFAQLAIWRRG